MQVKKLTTTERWYEAREGSTVAYGSTHERAITNLIKKLHVQGSRGDRAVPVRGVRD